LKQDGNQRKREIHYIKENEETQHKGGKES
jgi:hypothetical protein